MEAEANPKNVVGIASTSNYILHVAVAPTKDISTIMNTVFGLAKGGRLDLPTAIASSQIVWCNGLNKDLKKRIVVFAGGEAYNHTAADAEHLGLCLKKYDIACDAVNFGDQSSEKRQFLETLVAAAENSRNSRILHVEPHMSVGQALARFSNEIDQHILMALAINFPRKVGFWEELIHPSLKHAHGKVVIRNKLCPSCAGPIAALYPIYQLIRLLISVLRLPFSVLYFHMWNILATIAFPFKHIDKKKKDYHQA